MISIILPTYNRAETLKETVCSITDQDFKDWELIIVNDNSSDNTKYTCDEFSRQDRRIKVINLDKRCGSSTAFNIGAEQATKDMLLFTADDMPMEKFYIRNLYNCFLNNDKAVIFGRVICPNCPERDDDEVLVKISNLTGNIVGSFYKDTKKDVEIPMGHGCMLISRALFKQLGSIKVYPENGFREESDLCLRIKKAGYKLIFTPRAIIYHKITAEGGQRTSEMLYKRYSHKNHFLYLQRNYGVKIVYMFPMYFLKCVVWEDFLFPLYTKIRMG